MAVTSEAETSSRGFRHYVARLSQSVGRLGQSRIWLSKWVVAAIAGGAILLLGLLLLLVRYWDFDTFLNYFALGLLIFVLITLFYGIIAIHDVPYEIAVHRNHPHQDAIHAAGWVSLFTLHAIWPFLWIWAMLYRPDRGWGIQTEASAAPSNGLERLQQRVEALERKIEGRTD
jgi:hypothetical protein